MKKLTFLLCMLCLLLIVTVAACTSKPDGEDTSSETTAKITDEVTSEPSNETAEGQTTAETDPLETEEETTGEPELVSVIEGNVRVVLYSPSLLRLEEAKDGDFEDRPTFSVTGRDSFAGIPPEQVKQTEQNGRLLISTPYYTVSIKKGATSYQDVKLLDSTGENIWTPGSANHTAECYLPEPYATPAVWSFNDSPRLIKTEAAYTPVDEKNNGWSYIASVHDHYIFVPMGDAAQLRYDFNKLTGACEMVPVKTLGLWYSRFTALSDQNIYTLIKSYHRRDFPLDVFVVDTDWRLGSSTGYDVNTTYFPDIEEFYAKAAELGVLTLMNDHVRDYGGSMLEADQLNWFTENLQKKLKQGMSAWWYDRNWSYHLNSPFNGFHGDLLGQDMYYTLTDAVNGNNRTWMLSNVYWITNATISSPPHVSSHRYSLQWTGDIQSNSQALYRELENAVYAGAAAAMPYVISDIGGHFGDPDPDLYVRWVQYGALSSIMRFHACGPDRSPWIKGKTAQDISRVYIRMRYRLMPLYYSLARDNYDTGLPIMKRLDFVYPQYEEARRNDQYLLGDNILVAPITVNPDYQPLPAEWLTALDGSQGFTAEYYRNTNLSSEPYLTRVDPTIDFDWGDGSPANGIPSDNYSIRWTATFTNKAELPVRLATLSDDGIRVSVDGKWIINNWADSDSVLTENTAFQIEPGQTCEIVVEYYEGAWQAKAHLYYAPVLSSDGKEFREVFIPDGTWMDVWSGETFTGPQTVTVGHTVYTSPVFVRTGSFTVLADDADTLSTSDWGKLALDVYPDAKEADFTYELYEDDGTTEDYMNGNFRRTPIRMVQDGQKLAFRISPAKGDYATDFTTRTYTIRIHEAEGFTVDTVEVNGEAVEFTRLQKSEAYTADGLPFAFDTAACDSDVVLITFTAPIGETTVVTVNHADTSIIS